jgi:hypothetical protein
LTDIVPGKGAIDLISMAAENEAFTWSTTASDGKFPEIFTGGNFPYDVRASFFYLLVFYRIIYVLGNFPKFSGNFREISSLTTTTGSLWNSSQNFG